MIDNKLDKEAHYFIPIRPLHSVPGLYSYTVSNDVEDMVECKLEPYDFGEYSYKVYLVPVNELDKFKYGREQFYTDDFISLVRSNRLVKKISETQHVEHIEVIEPLTELAYVVHSGSVVVD